MKPRVLTVEAQADRIVFESLYGDGCCSCHINAPCECCVHPGNPSNQEDDDECWVEGDDDVVTKESA